MSAIFLIGKGDGFRRFLVSLEILDTIPILEAQQKLHDILRITLADKIVESPDEIKTLIASIPSLDVSCNVRMITRNVFTHGFDTPFPPIETQDQGDGDNTEGSGRRFGLTAFGARFREVLEARWQNERNVETSLRMLDCMASDHPQLAAFEPRESIIYAEPVHPKVIKKAHRSQQMAKQRHEKHAQQQDKFSRQKHQSFHKTTYR
jgi:hypothetical protein